jgi:nicotinamidase/pyrazinamidase
MRFDPRETVLVDVDTQVDFVEPAGALYVPRAEMLKPNFARLVEAARGRGLTIVASADAHPADDPEFTVFPPHCLAGSAGQKRVSETEPDRSFVIAIDGTAPREARDRGATIVLEKVACDLFTNPAADRVLRETQAKTAIVFGVALDYCVRAAALGLRARGYETVLVRDATEPVTREGGEETERELERAGVRFASTEEIVRALA